jgi:hypothetical protein
MDSTVVHSSRHANDHRSVRPPQSARDIHVEIQFGCGDIELPNRHLTSGIAPLFGWHAFFQAIENPMGLILPRGPTQVTSAQQMKMEVKNALARVGACIDDYAKAFLRDALFVRELGNNQKNMANYFSIGSVQIRKRRDMLARDNQNMNRRLRIDVLKGQDRVIFVDHITLNLLLDNATE